MKNHFEQIRCCITGVLHDQ